MRRVLIAQLWPKLAGEVRAVLLREGYLDLAEQIDSLEMRAMCDCGDDFCQTIYCVPPPKGVWGPGYRNLDPDPPWEGYLIVGVLDDRIVELEILYREPLD